MFGTPEMFGCIVLICIILYIINIVKEECIPSNSIIYRDVDLQNNDVLNEKVSGLYIVKTGIYYSITPSFGKKYFCHWSLMTKTDKGNMFVISPTGHGSVNIHKVLKEYIYKERGYKFIRGGTLGKHIIFSKKIVPRYVVSVNDVINDMMKINKNIKYLPFSMNCQYVVSYVLETYIDGKIPKLSSIDSMKRIMNDLIFGYKF